MSSGAFWTIMGVTAKGKSSTPDFLNAVTTSTTMSDETKEWSATAVQDSSTSKAISLCFQSFAHSRITQLLRLHAAIKFLGKDFPSELASISTEPCMMKLADCIKDEALLLAIAVNAPGAVTANDENCLSFEGETEICYDGTTTGGYDGDWGYSPKLVLLLKVEIMEVLLLPLVIPPFST
jgi:hypothetical protein